MGKRNKVTTRDIAEHTGLSQSTVSMILSKRPNVSFSRETIKKVEEAAKLLGYKKPEAGAKKKIMNLSSTIVVFCPTLSNVYYALLCQYIIEQATTYGYKVLQIATGREAEKEAEYLELLSGLEVAGVIFSYPPEKLASANALSKQVPVVSIGDKPDTCRFDSVELDSKKPGYLIGEHLLSLGHKKITYITPPLKAKEIGRLHRLEGLKMSFAERGYDPEECVNVLAATRSMYEKYSAENREYENGYYQAAKALREGTDSTAFVGNNDMTAFGIMAAISEFGYRIPNDYSVCGFDNIPLSQMPQISLTTIEHAYAHKGKEAVDMIYRKNQQKQSPGRRHYIMRMEYEPELIIRRSTGKCKN